MQRGESNALSGAMPFPTEAMTNEDGKTSLFLPSTMALAIRIGLQQLPERTEDREHPNRKQYQELMGEVARSLTPAKRQAVPSCKRPKMT
jgi:hypothetical protein